MQVMTLKGNVNDLRKLGTRLQRFPITLAATVASRSAPELTRLARLAFAQRRTVYGDRRPDGVAGSLSLVRTGDTERTVHFARVGTIVRCVLGPRYARYLVGRFRILPMGRMPASWSATLRRIVFEESP